MVDWAIYLSVLRQETVNNSVIPGKNECRPWSFFFSSFFVAVFFSFSFFLRLIGCRDDYPTLDIWVGIDRTSTYISLRCVDHGQRKN